jgi:Arc/MetJ family transcription regulator
MSITSRCRRAAAGPWAEEREGGRVAATRTNIELDDELVETTMRLYGTTTKRETVDLALRRPIGSQSGTQDALRARGRRLGR